MCAYVCVCVCVLWVFLWYGFPVYSLFVIGLSEMFSTQGAKKQTDPFFVLRRNLP